ncbi:unnamed protein product [Caenorhabditis angaria]|uniref:protein-tyrosine-phosphatase n=1 Tax=Caenorhabditis angaria TaxID=860376 RepID=A0A9P1ITB3_9PELO|nr:unnamed protein product [Caenorhabditis angaria]
MIWPIIDGLYLAQYSVVYGSERKQTFEKHNIKRVLTVTDAAISEEVRVKGVEYIFFEMFDIDSQEILGNGLLEKCVKLVKESIEKKENILVHCLVAVSRSVTICLAYLMFKNQWSLQKSLKYMKEIRPAISPSNGFLEQLKIFEKSNFNLNHELYTSVRLEIPNSDQVLYRHPVEQNTNVLRYKCQKCRKILFNISNIKHGEENCQKIIIEPMNWLNLSDTSCTITHTCGAKLGNFVFSGSNCPTCRTFESPYICIDKSNIDRVLPIQ